MSSMPVVLTLTEREPYRLDAGELSEETATVLHRKHSKRIKIQWPSPVTDGQWVLKTGGWIGYLPVTEQLSIAVRPKVAVQNVFGMLEYAYRLKSFRVMAGLYGSSTLEELYSRLASVLAKRVSDRVRQGLLRAYDPHAADLPYLRGRLVTSRLHRCAATPSLPCEFEEHGADIEDNQILLWTLYLLARVEGLHDKARLDCSRPAVPEPVGHLKRSHFHHPRNRYWLQCKAQPGATGDAGSGRDSCTATQGPRRGILTARGSA